MEPASAQTEIQQRNSKVENKRVVGKLLSRLGFPSELGNSSWLEKQEKCKE